MKVVILAGGLGTRLSEETDVRPKPMVEIGGIPILVHIMKIYSYYGCKDFVICTGYKEEHIQKYFVDNKYLLNSEYWNINLISTGDNTMTGGRIKKIKEHTKDQPFMLTYGDGVANINLNDLFKFHQNHGKTLTVTAVQPTGRFGGLKIDHKTNVVKQFNEKPKGDGIWINGGFFVCNPNIFDYIEGDSTTFEQEPMNKLVEESQLMCYKHSGFWKCMDTLKDKNDLNHLWRINQAEWKLW
jgi:glucose-1-phosphate cytidylyltransferase